MAPTIELEMSAGTADVVSWHLQAAMVAKATANFKLRILSKRGIGDRATRWDHAPGLRPTTSAAANRGARLAPQGHVRSHIWDAPRSVPPSTDHGIAPAA
jgi:hypothetical protein